MRSRVSPSLSVRLSGTRRKGVSPAARSFGKEISVTKHRPRTSAGAAAEVDIHAAVRDASAELERRKAYELLKHLERRITDYPPVPGAPPYVETFPDIAKS